MKLAGQECSVKTAYTVKVKAWKMTIVQRIAAVQVTAYQVNVTVIPGFQVLIVTHFYRIAPVPDTENAVKTPSVYVTTTIVEVTVVYSLLQTVLGTAPITVSVTSGSATVS